MEWNYFKITQLIYKFNYSFSLWGLSRKWGIAAAVYVQLLVNKVRKFYEQYKHFEDTVVQNKHQCMKGEHIYENTHRKVSNYTGDF